MTNTNPTDHIPAGSTVILPDGSTAIAYPETGRLGDRSNTGFCGRYRTVQDGRTDTGWTREQLIVTRRG